MSAPYRVRLADWASDEPALREVRRLVFIVEQGVTADLEWDGIDHECQHSLAEDEEARPIGCARLLPDGHIGRVAVLAHWRGCGVGDALLVRLMELARDLGHRRVALSAQTHALAFYARHGFVAYGPEYDDAGILHRAMERPL
ncbi:MAG: GNAT family N-acetyltransferase [Casimicrobiaceae bacterium]